MLAIASSLYLISTVVFCVFCLVIGVRLLRLSRRTGGRPELLLGLALALTGGVGYGTLIGLVIANQLHQLGPSAWIPVLVGFGNAAHDVGVFCFLGFIITVFRPGERWALALAGLMAAVLTIGLIGQAVEGFAQPGATGFWYWVGYSVTATYPLWIAAEAFRYHALMRRRAALGLADPLVVTRFLLWGMASLLSIAAIWTVTFPAVLGLPLEQQTRIAPLTMMLPGIFGCGCVTSYWLTFFPPAWYRARFAIAR